MAEQIEPGAIVECTDYPLGAVERVADDGALIVRPARADYLLRIPRDLVASADAGRVCLKVRLQDVEQYALDERGERQAAGGVETQATKAAPTAEEVLGLPTGELPTSPQTG
ncbi:MAG TPA: hypothetical protein VK066_08155 [Chloroflexota bacterium]|nr:hypothetical protein [Chloroflexota bacterium]